MKKINIKAVAIKAGGVTAGAIVATKLNSIKLGEKTIGAMDGKVRGILKIALGAFAPQLAKAKPGGVVEHVATGLMAVGGLELANSFITDQTKKLSIAGVGDLPALGSIGADIFFDEQYSGGAGNEMEIDVD